MNLENLNLSVRTTNLLFRKGLKTAEDLMHVLDTPAKREELKDYLGERGYQEVMDEMPVEDGFSDWDVTDLPDLPDLPEQEISVLSADYTKALKLNQHIKAHAQIAQESLYEVCKGLKEMRDNKLYKELGYQNFEEYCEKEVGLKRHMAYKYAEIAEIENVESIQHLGVTKLSLLAKLDEPQREEIQQKVDIETVTVKDLRTQLSAMKQKNSDQRDQYEKQLQEQRKNFELDERRLIQDMSEARRKEKELSQQIFQLQQQISELENKPTEYMQSTAELEEIARLKETVGSLLEEKQTLQEENALLCDEITGKEQVISELSEQLEDDGWRNSEAEFKARLKVLESAFSSLTALIVGKQNQHVDMSLKIGAVQRISQKYFDLMKEDAE